MTCYLASEHPRPSSVTSEYYFRQLNGFPVINNVTGKCLFGEEYEREVCFYLSKHGEINCNDRVCLIGEESGWAVTIQERLFLNKDIYFIDCNLQQSKLKETRKYLINQKQIVDGLRQLNETYFKYHSGLVEMHERLSFLTIQKTIDPLYRFPRIDTIIK